MKHEIRPGDRYDRMNGTNDYCIVLEGGPTTARAHPTIVYYNDGKASLIGAIKQSDVGIVWEPHTVDKVQPFPESWGVIDFAGAVVDQTWSAHCIPEMIGWQSEAPWWFHAYTNPNGDPTIDVNRITR